MDIEVNYKNKKRYNTARYPIRQPIYLTALIWLLSKCALIGKKYKVEKEQGTGFQLAKYRPLIKNENISVFSKKTHNYMPQMELLDKPKKVKRKSGSNSNSDSSPLKYSDDRVSVYTHKYPTNILRYNRQRGLHPTQKPVDLLEYLVKTYTNEGELILDFTMGSGSTGVACINTNRKFIGIELDEKYFEIAKNRIEETLKTTKN